MLDLMWFYFGILATFLVRDVLEALLHVLNEYRTPGSKLWVERAKRMEAQKERERLASIVACTWERCESMRSGVGKAMAMK